MSQIEPQIGECFEDAPKVLMTRIVGLADTPITQATLTTLTYLVKQYASRQDAESDSDATVITAETGLTISTTIFNTLQTNNGWPTDVDPLGYNCLLTVPATAFATKGKWYRVEVWCHPTSGDDFPGALFVLYCNPTARD